MENKKFGIDNTEKLGFGMLLASVGGLMDVYSYTIRGKVFVTGETGNLVLLATNLADKNYIGMFHALVPIISFLIGLFISRHLFNSIFKENQLIWKRGILITSILILFITGLIPRYYPHIIANSLLAFAAALQYCAFRKFDTGENYATIFCTGNIRSCLDNFYKAIIKKDKQSLKSALKYSTIIFSFFAGACIGTLVSAFLQEKTIWTAALALSVALIISFGLNVNTHKNTVLAD